MSFTSEKAPEMPKIPGIEGKLDKLADITTKSAEKMMEGVEKIVTNLTPSEAAALAAITVGTLAYLSLENKKDKEEVKKNPEQEEKRENEEAKVPAAVKPAIDQIRQKAAEKAEQLHTERYWKLDHPGKGRIHVWHPNYKGDPPDNIVIYLHGYGKNSADMSWNQDKVGEQFRKSGRKALFIVPESQRRDGPILWKNLDELIAYVKQATGVDAKKRVTIMGHSGAYATLSDWLKYDFVQETILVDSIYGNPGKFREWAKKEGKRLVIAVAQGESATKRYAEQVVRDNKDAKIYNGTPKYSEETRVAKLIYFTTQYSHGDMARDKSNVISGALSLAGAPEKMPAGKGTEFAEVRSGSRYLKYQPDQDIVKKLTDSFSKNETLASAGDGTRLKQSVNVSFQYARNIANGMGYDIRINSGYRTPERQKELHESVKPENRGKLVASAGSSWHQSGGAVDCSLVRLGSNESLTPTSAKNDKPSQYTDILERCMNRAGFVRLSNESWHFEIGSAGWADIMQKQGYIKSDARLANYTYKRDQLTG